jgi:hypothetical protein
MLAKQPGMAVTIWHVVNTLRFLPYGRGCILSLLCTVRNIYPTNSHQVELAVKELPIDHFQLGTLVYSVLDLLTRAMGSHYASMDSSSKDLKRRLRKVRIE